MRTIVTLTLIGLLSSRASANEVKCANEVKRATLGAPGDRGMQHGLLQYRKVTLGQGKHGPWAELVVPARDDSGRYIAKEVRTADGGRFLVRRAEAPHRGGGKLIKIRGIYVGPGNERRGFDREYLVDRNGNRKPIHLDQLRGLPLDPYAYDHLRYVFDAGDMALRHDQPLVRQVTEQLRASGH